MFTKENMLNFIQWYDSKDEDDCHKTFEEEFNEWNDNRILKEINECEKMTSNQRHQLSMFDKIEEALSKRPFANDELKFILKAIRNSKSYVTVLSGLD